MGLVELKVFVKAVLEAFVLSVGVGTVDDGLNWIIVHFLKRGVSYVGWIFVGFGLDFGVEGYCCIERGWG